MGTAYFGTITAGKYECGSAASTASRVALSERSTEMRINPTRVCRSCKRELPRDHFQPKPTERSPHDLDRRCRECNRKPIPSAIDGGDGTWRIPLTQHRFAIVDRCDVDKVCQLRWHVRPHESGFYAVSRGAGRPRSAPKIIMHRFVLDADDGVIIDHINHDGLDNRRANLRIATYNQNRANQTINRQASSGSRYLGVRRVESGKWEVCLRWNGERFYVGLFDSEVVAAIARDRKAIELHGEFASLNFPNLRVDTMRADDV